ncbi:hypothetical protein LTR91_013476 [Friedmanniomyces endolithicus]|uniref:Glutamine amidotransferase type-2 domain-containing protein n=2 Tax=Friedmanniomyces endolithicus TaxID=329885 RepID=A0AAN6KDR5_9PEZI|nr:hypothetical protein LTS09_011591 [Friedmanniomyces endolithicus]KAK0844641.1 hypothetical protein LTR03_007971 [Friedmanniomyces endolithicus]KAK0871712.1 hypothetical protein LTS02_001776 [Friedmanniomyces endolithicus]KAK0878878.1 hypothetical protein LTR87_007328 [Friedmanniomyces endolithicus]KAK0911361.1 hypothetical protein LTR57_015387 [Friedmanniomyces endolithicus]
MCGIWCAVSTHRPIWPCAETLRLLERRGPDSSGRSQVTLERTATTGQPETTYVTFYSTVLSLRGHGTVGQPHRSSSGSTLCWNGEAWEIAGHSPLLDNDTEAVANLLDSKACTPCEPMSRSDAVHERARAMAKALAQIVGPYALVYHDSSNDILYFGRDFLGRRSLLIRKTPDGALLVSSVAGAVSGQDETAWSEVEADGLYYVDLRMSGTNCDSQYIVHKVPYYFASSGAKAPGSSVIPSLSLNRSIPPTYTRLNISAPAVCHLEQLLISSLRRRVNNIRTPVAVPPISHLAILFSGGLDCTVLARLAHDIYPTNQTIDLLNVAFENPRVHKSHSSGSTNPYELCPDRITGRASHAQLIRVCPGRNWIFVAIDVPYTETMAHKQNVIDLMQPHNTEMDLSICSALYFASRGIGISSSSSDLPLPETMYTTGVKVLLSGLGADELFGGYQRHATAFNRNGFTGLLDELDLDIGRLGKRNLGRDDRVISHWGREARFPFLDEDLLAWAMNAPVTEKCGFGESEVSQEQMEDESELLEPGKKVLRCLAWKLGMKQVAKEKKRAIQFGARTAKMETGRTKGTQLLS